MTEPLLQIILAAVLFIAVVTDLKSCRIPNWLTVPAMACGLLVHTLFDGQSGLIMSLEGLGLGLGLFLVFYVMGGMGAGDVKLMAAIGSILGPAGVLSVAVMTGLLGGVYAAAAMIANWGLRETVQRVKTMLLTQTGDPESDFTVTPRSQLQLRYALVIGLGTLLSQLVVR
ncbi:MAG: A24 family peptidase [Nitrospiraceae bacterium]